MTMYNVHVYREMRLFFPGIEANTPEEAARMAADKLTEEAESTEDCQGENLAALVDVVTDDQYEHSVTIDFEQERLRKAASELQAALLAILPYAENEAEALTECHRRYGDAALAPEVAACETALAKAHAALAQAKGDSV